MELVGRPIYHADSPFSAVGAWMRDAMPMTGEMEAKRWVTDGYASPVLYEYKDEQDLIKKKQLIKYYMNYLVVGTGAVLYNGSFYYHRYNSPDIVRYDLYAAEENITKIEGTTSNFCIPHQYHKIIFQIWPMWIANERRATMELTTTLDSQSATVPIDKPICTESLTTMQISLWTRMAYGWCI